MKGVNYKKYAEDHQIQPIARNVYGHETLKCYWDVCLLESLSKFDFKMKPASAFKPKILIPAGYYK